MVANLIYYLHIGKLLMSLFYMSIILFHIFFQNICLFLALIASAQGEYVGSNDSYDKEWYVDSYGVLYYDTGMDRFLVRCHINVVMSFLTSTNSSNCPNKFD